MANCKDCLHIVCCERDADENGGILDYSYAEKCDLFKDHSRFVEIPLEEEERCEDCLHYEACQSWIRHGKTLYDDFAYSTKGCPFFDGQSRFAEMVRCKDCEYYNVYRLECHNEHMNGYIGIDGFCSYAKRKTEN